MSDIPCSNIFINRSSRSRTIKERINKWDYMKLKTFCTAKGNITVQPLWETVWDFLKKLKMELSFDPAISVLGLYLKNSEIWIQKNLCTPMFIAALCTIAKCWKQPKCPSVNEWIKKLWYTYTMEYCAAERKKELIPFATAWIELESIMLSEISQVVKDKYCMISLISGTYSTKQTSKKK